MDRLFGLFMKIKLRSLTRARDGVIATASRQIENLMTRLKLPPPARTRNGAIGATVLIICIALAVAATTLAPRADKVSEADLSEQSRRVGTLYYPAPKQWASLTIEPVTEQVFRSEHLTEGKIAVDEDRATLVFSPYSGRVIKLLAKPGDMVVAGQPLFVVEAPDMVQAQNDFISAVAGLNKARSRSISPRSSSSRIRSLYDTSAAPLRDLQQSQAATLAAQNDVRSAETSLEVVRNRLRILGKTDEEITKFGETGAISPLTTIYSPIAGTVVQRKVGPGQYVNTTSNSASRQRPDLRHRRSVHRLAGRLCARIRGAERAGRASLAFHRAGLSEPRVHRPTSPMSRPRSTPAPDDCWCARRSTIRKACCGLKCSPASPS